MADVIADPELDPAATYAVDPARVRALTARVIASGGERELRTTTPMTGAPLAVLPVSSAGDVVHAVELARAAQGGWEATPVADRAAVMLRLHDLLLDRQPQLLDLVQLESGKARGHAFEEIGDCAIVARHYARRGPSLLADTHHVGVLPLLSRAVEHHRPKGVVGIVSPWNYPLSLAVSDAIPALIAGNAVVLRPDPQGSLTALAAAELFAEAGCPTGCCRSCSGRATRPGRPSSTTPTT
jgi:succinate-semialdehyde dehydrogenase/glutarate-semialdehyde dehydrogenase